MKNILLIIATVSAFQGMQAMDAQQAYKDYKKGLAMHKNNLGSLRADDEVLKSTVQNCAIAGALAAFEQIENNNSKILISPANSLNIHKDESAYPSFLRCFNDRGYNPAVKSILTSLAFTKRMPVGPREVFAAGAHPYTGSLLLIEAEKAAEAMNEQEALKAFETEEKTK